MASTKDTGVDFIYRIMADVKLLQDEMARLGRSTSELQLGLKAEKESRESDVGALHARLSQERAAETLVRGGLEKRQEEFEGKTKTWVGALGKDCLATKEQLQQLQQQADADRQSAAESVQDLGVRIGSVDAFAQTRAKASDLQALEPRITDAESSLDKLASDLKTKAATATVNAMSDRVTNLAMDVQAGQVRAQSEKETFQASLSKLDGSLSKTERQVESDRERTSACLVALEKELATKAAKAETDLIAPKVLNTAADRIESRALDFERSLGLHKQEMQPLRSRLEALETAFPTRADAAEIPRLSLAIAEQAARHDAHAQEHGLRLERVAAEVQRHMGKLESVESRSVVLERTLGGKAEAHEHFTKDTTQELLRDFYRREEIDAMLSRVWWRVGDMSKGRTAPLSAR